MGTILLSVGLFCSEEIVKTSKCLNSLVSDVSFIFDVGLLIKQQKQHATILQVSLLGTSYTLSNALKVIFENEVEIFIHKQIAKGNLQYFDR